MTTPTRLSVVSVEAAITLSVELFCKLTSDPIGIDSVVAYPCDNDVTANAGTQNTILAKSIATIVVGRLWTRGMAAAPSYAYL